MRASSRGSSPVKAQNRGLPGLHCCRSTGYARLGRRVLTSTGERRTAATCAQEFRLLITMSAWCSWEQGCEPARLAPEGSAADRSCQRERVVMPPAGARLGRETPFGTSSAATATSSAATVAIHRSDCRPLCTCIFVASRHLATTSCLPHEAAACCCRTVTDRTQFDVTDLGNGRKVRDLRDAAAPHHA